MDTPPVNTELIRWDVPFAELRGMDTWVIREGDAEDFTIVVAPLSQNHPKDNYPKYLLQFKKVITLLFYDETCASHRLYYRMSGWKKGVRAYRWIGSPWLEGYKGCFMPDRDRLHHFVILGDGNLVEVISVGEPEIEQVNAKRYIEVKFEI